LAELPAEGKFHAVDDAEANAVIADSSHMILHNEMIGRLLRNMYSRIQDLEVEVAGLKASKQAKRSVTP
jgi:hypothetical protein